MKTHTRTLLWRNGSHPFLSRIPTTDSYTGWDNETSRITVTCSAPTKCRTSEKWKDPGKPEKSHKVETTAVGPRLKFSIDPRIEQVGPFGTLVLRNTYAAGKWTGYKMDESATLTVTGTGPDGKEATSTETQLKTHVCTAGDKGKLVCKSTSKVNGKLSTEATLSIQLVIETSGETGIVQEYVLEATSTLYNYDDGGTVISRTSEKTEYDPLWREVKFSRTERFPVQEQGEPGTAPRSREDVYSSTETTTYSGQTRRPLRWESTIDGKKDTVTTYSY